MLAAPLPLINLFFFFSSSSSSPSSSCPSLTSETVARPFVATGADADLLASLLAGIKSTGSGFRILVLSLGRA